MKRITTFAILFAFVSLIPLASRPASAFEQGGVSDAVMGVMEEPSGPAPVATQVQATPQSPSPSPAVSADAQKKRVVVYPFDYSAVKSESQAIFGTQANIGEGIRSMIQMRLTQEGKVVVVERGKIDAILKEQDGAAGSRMQQGTGPRIGRVVGADAVLAGDIVVFGRDDKKKGVNGEVFSGICAWCAKGVGAAQGFKKEEKAVVVINYRLVNAETSEIIASGEKRGESKRSSKSVGGFAAGWNGGGGGGVDMTSSNFSETIIGEATQDCVNQIVAEFTAQTEAMKKTLRDVEALVAVVNGNSIILNAGSNEGIVAGETFEIFHVDQEVRDPVTKELLDKTVTKVGDCQITSVREKIATCSYAGSPAAVGMIARKKP